MKNEDMEETIMSSVNDLLKAIANRDYSQEYINEDISFVNTLMQFTNMFTVALLR